MTHRRVRIERPFAEQRELAIERVGPVQRVLPLFALYGRPAIGKPVFRAFVAARANELQELRVRGEAIREPIRLEEHPMASELVVEAEALAAMSDLDDATRKFDEREWHGRVVPRW